MKFALIPTLFYVLCLCMILSACSSEPGPDRGSASRTIDRGFARDSISLHDSLLLRVLPDKLEGFTDHIDQGSTFRSGARPYAEVSRTFFSKDKSRYLAITLGDFAGDSAAWQSFTDEIKLRGQNKLRESRKIQLGPGGTVAQYTLDKLAKTSGLEAVTAYRFYTSIRGNQSPDKEKLAKCWEYIDWAQLSQLTREYRSL